MDLTGSLSQDGVVQTYSIRGMTCDNCVRHVTEAIASVDGVTAVRVDLSSASAEVQGDASASAIAAAVIEAGYEAST